MAAVAAATLIATVSAPGPRVLSGWEPERVWSSEIDWEPVVSVTTDGERVYQATTRYGAPECAECPDPAIVVRRSDDGGRTFGSDVYVARGGRGQNDPQIRVVADGTVYVAYIQDYRPGVVLVRSGDGGDTWTDPLVVAGDGPHAGRTTPGW